MKKNLFSMSVIALTTLTSLGTANATDLNVTFTANLLETTCNMKLVGGTGSDTEQTLKIGDSNGQVRLDAVKAGTATANFKIEIVECFHTWILCFFGFTNLRFIRPIKNKIWIKIPQSPRTHFIYIIFFY